MDPGSHLKPRSGHAVLINGNATFDLADHDGVPDELPDAMGGNGLVALGSSGGIVLTSTMFGPVAVTVEIHPAEPALDLSGWEEAVETRQHTPSGAVSVCCIVSGEYPVDGLPSLSVEPDSWYGIRVHARGRTEAAKYAVAPDDPVETFLIQMWPAEPGPEQILRAAAHGS